jgi:hypothetical protein
LHILTVIRSDPRPKDEKIPGITRAYEVSSDPRLALELANLFTLLDKMDDARQYYDKVFRMYNPAHLNVWEEAFVFLCHEALNGGGPEMAMDLIEEAKSMCGTSKIISRWEHKMMEEVGLIKYKKNPRRLEPPLAQT